MRDAGHSTLVTERLLLRRPRPEDVDVIYDIYRDPRASAHNPSNLLRDRGGAESLYRSWDEHWRTTGFGYWTLLRHGSDLPVGFCGLRYMWFHDDQVTNLFYGLHPRCWGRGLAVEAARAAVDWAAKHLPGVAVVARIRPENLASQRVAARAGLTRAEHLDGLGFDGLERIWVTQPVRERPSGSRTRISST